MLSVDPYSLHFYTKSKRYGFTPFKITLDIVPSIKTAKYVIEVTYNGETTAFTNNKIGLYLPGKYDVTYKSDKLIGKSTVIIYPDYDIEKELTCYINLIPENYLNSAYIYTSDNPKEIISNIFRINKNPIKPDTFNIIKSLFAYSRCPIIFGNRYCYTDSIYLDNIGFTDAIILGEDFRDSLTSVLHEYVHSIVFSEIANSDLIIFDETIAVYSVLLLSRLIGIDDDTSFIDLYKLSNRELPEFISIIILDTVKFIYDIITEKIRPNGEYSEFNINQLNDIMGNND